VGCLTLLIAVGLSGTWLRSLSLEDAARFSIFSRRHLLCSVHQNMEWHSWKERITDPPMPNWQSKSNRERLPSRPLASGSTRGLSVEINKSETRPMPADLAHARIFKPETRQLLSCVIPYWLLVPALTILSAYLILWKPQKPPSLLVRCQRQPGHANQ
jgi:hypothetical protein